MRIRESCEIGNVVKGLRAKDDWQRETGEGKRRGKPARKNGHLTGYWPLNEWYARERQGNDPRQIRGVGDMMRFAIPSLMVLGVMVSACDQSTIEAAVQQRGEALGTASSEGDNLHDGAATDLGPDFGAIDRARPAGLDRQRFQMIVEVSGDAFPHALFKSPAHAQNAGYCTSSGFGDVTKVIDASDPNTGQRFYFIECSEADPRAVGVLQADDPQAGGGSSGTSTSAEALINALANGASSAADEAPYADPYANCPIGQGGYPVVTEDCISRY